MLKRLFTTLLVAIMMMSMCVGISAVETKAPEGQKNIFEVWGDIETEEYWDDITWKVRLNGGGKTTICNLLPRFYRCVDGKISIGGTDINDVRTVDLRSKIAVVAQDVFLFSGSVRDNIAYGSPDKTEAEIIQAAKRANIHEYVTSLPDGYDTEVGERGVKLSGGQKQRIAIARAFLKNPPILILDEATSALDNMTEMQVQASLAELAEGRTTFVTAHRLSTVKNADIILVITDGEITERGTHEQLVEQGGVYAELYRYQFRE